MEGRIQIWDWHCIQVLVFSKCFRAFNKKNLIKTRYYDRALRVRVERHMKN